MDPRDFNLTKAAYSVDELLNILPFGRTTLYKAVKAGRLHAVKLGRSTLFRAADVAAFLSSLPPVGRNNEGPKVA